MRSINAKLHVRIWRNICYSIPRVYTNANNSKESWQAINELLNKKPKTTQVKQLIVDNQTITDDKEIADCFNEYFSSIGSKLSNNIQNNDIDPLTFVTPVSKTFHFENVTAVQVVYDALNQIDLKKSAGLDGINIRLHT